MDVRMPGMGEESAALPGDLRAPGVTEGSEAGSCPAEAGKDGQWTLFLQCGEDSQKLAGKAQGKEQGSPGVAPPGESRATQPPCIGFFLWEVAHACPGAGGGRAHR